MKVSITSTQPKYDYQFEVAEVADTGIIGIYGVSGSGKSSLLNALAGYTDNNKGSITFNNKQLQGVVKCSYMNQHPILFPHWTVLENLNFALKYSNNSIGLLDDLVIQLECKDLLNKLPDQLSGGEKQRVAYIRALLLIEDNSLVLLDEPFSALDNRLRKVALNLLNQYKNKCLIFLVTHQISELYHQADEIIVIKDGKVDFHDSTVKAMASGYGDLPLASKIVLAGAKQSVDQSVIYADDVSIALHKNPDCSIVHQLDASIDEITVIDDTAIIKLLLNDNKQTLQAKITLASLQHLNLEEKHKQKQPVVASFKAMASR